MSANESVIPRARLGIIAGSGPEAGIDLWSKLLTEARSLLGQGFRGDLDAPEVTVLSNPRLGLSMDMAHCEAQVRTELMATIRMMDALTDGFAIACNTLHCFSAEIRELALRSTFFSIVDATARSLRSDGYGRIGLLGSKTVMSFGADSPYRRLQEEFDCEQVQDPDSVHELIYDIKRLGDVRPVRERCARLIASLEAPVVVLACTELPLVVRQVQGKILVDPSAVLARDLARWIYGRREASAAVGVQP